MSLEDVIAALEAVDPTWVVPHGFTNPHSYRGDYTELAFEPATNITVGEMLAAARSAVGAVYKGYKGGEFEMGVLSECWIATYGDSSEDLLGPMLLRFMLDTAHPPTDPASVSETLTCRHCGTAIVVCECLYQYSTPHWQDNEANAYCADSTFRHEPCEVTP